MKMYTLVFKYILMITYISVHTSILIILYFPMQFTKLGVTTYNYFRLRNVVYKLFVVMFIGANNAQQTQKKK